MSKTTGAIHNIMLLDDLACRDSVIHKLNPIVKLITAVVYLTAVVSFGRYDISGILPLFFYPVVVFYLSDIPIAPILKRVLFVVPFIILIGILNPVIDNSRIFAYGISISRGWIVFASVFIKSILTVTATVLLIATTKTESIANAMRKLYVPRIFVLQLLLTYRYITVLLEKAEKTARAYSLRSPAQKGIIFKVWGSLAGQLLLRTYDRAERVYRAMCLRGFSGDYNTGENMGTNAGDIVFIALWTAFFLFARFFNIPEQIGQIITGVVK